MKEHQLNLVSIAGVHYGTKIVNWLDKYHIQPLAGLPSILANEFRWESQFATTLLKSWNNKQIEWEENNVKTRHFFCATLEDDKVFDYTSSLPILQGKNNQYNIYHGETHQTIVSAAQKDILDWIKNS